MNHSIDRFQDVHLHASALQGWKNTYSQISAGTLESSLMQLSGARSHAFRERIGQRVVQHGETPRDKVCVAMPVGMYGIASIQGREADANSIFFLRSGQEYMCHMPKDMDLLGITFQRDFFEETIEKTPHGREIEALFKQPLIRVPAKRLAECRRRLLAMFTEAVINDDFGDTLEHEHELEQAMLDELVGLLSDPECDRRQRPPSTTHSFIVEKCHLLTMSDAFNTPSVIELCQRLQVSRRTVQNSFRNVAETTPLNYLRCVRLNGVRRELMHTCAAALSVGDAAGNWGFFHLSHFAADYQELFGELPSQTRRAVVPRRLDS